VGSRNFASIAAQNGTQTITGSPVITLTGGASGGVDNEANSANIQSNVGLQSITAGTTSLTAGAGGIVNFATITAPSQTLTVHGSLALTGGGSAPATTGAGARIGGLGGSIATPTQVTLTVDNDI